MGENLTPAQERVLGYVAAGYGVAETAVHLHIALSTARTHIKVIQERLDLHSLQALTAWWWRRHTAQVTTAARAVVDMPHEQGLAELAHRVRALRDTLDHDRSPVA